MVWVVAFLGTIFLGVEIGLGFAVALSLLIVMYKAVYPRTAVLGRLPGTHFFRNVKQYPNAERYDGLIVCRINTPLFFANAQSVRDKIRKYKRVAEAQLAERATSGGIDRVKYIILDLVSMSHIDTTALHVLEDMYVTQQKLGVQICFCSPLVLVMKRFIQSGLVDVVGRQHFFTSDFDAVHWCLSEMDAAQQQQKGAESENGNNTGEILANESDGVENV